MATILDSGVLSQFWLIFAFLFVLVMVYGIVTFAHFFGNNKVLQALVAFLFAIIVLIIPKIGKVFVVVMPWFVLLLMLIAFLLLAYKMFGVTDADLHTVIKNERGVIWTILSIIVLIFLWGIVHVFGTPYIAAEGEQAAIGPGPGFAGTLGAVFFHPKVLGTVFILLVAVFTIGILAGETVQKGGHGGGH